MVYFISVMVLSSKQLTCILFSINAIVLDFHFKMIT